MRPPFRSSISRLGVRPDGDDETAVVAPRPRGSRRPHTDARVAAVRRLIEETTLTYGEIAAKTGVGRASICRWTRDGGWKRPPFAPRATDTVPSIRASAKLKMRMLAARLSAIAQRYVRELEETPNVELDKLSAALELVKMAKLETMGRRRRRRWVIGETRTGASWMTRVEATRTALKELHRGGVDIGRAPQEAPDLVIDARLPPDDHPALHPRRSGRRSKRNAHHARMLERDRG